MRSPSPLSARVARPVLALVLVIGAAGCGPSSDGTDREPPSEWSPEVSLTREPSLSTFEVEEAIQTWLPALLGLEIAEAQGAYRDITSRFGEDPACPPYVEEHSGEGYTTRYWGYYQEEGSCTASNGDHVNAYGEEYIYTTSTAAGTDDWTELLLEGTLISAEGYSLTGYAYLDDQVYTYRNGDMYWYRAVIGDLDWEGATTWSTGTVEGSWLDLGRGAHLEMNAERSGSSTTLYGHGGLDGLPGPVNAISVEAFVLASDPCPLEPAGWLSVADTEGRWYTVAWDAPTAEEPDRSTDACDGCADLTFDATSLGRACVDLSDLVGWDSPW